LIQGLLFEKPKARTIDSVPRICLRPYQHDSITGIIDQFKACRSTLLVLPTGCGKTICFAALIDRMKSGRCMVLAHREELVFQAADKIKRVTGESCDIEMANHWADDYGNARIVVSSIQTQIAGENGNGRMTRFRPHDFSLIIIDEAHHATAGSYRKVIDWYKRNPEVKILGVTATPDRHDEEALGQIFETVAYDYEINNAVNDGWLTPIKVSSVVVDGLDFSGIRTTAGDLNGADLAQVMEEERNLHAIAAPTIELARGRKTLVFASSVAHAERLCEIFNRHISGCANWVCGKTNKEERRRIFKDYARGNFQFLCNVGVATEGFDEPGIEVISLARPTKSRALYAQMIGRGTRPLPGVVDGVTEDAARRRAIAESRKPFLEVIDFVGNSGRHKLISAADILGGNYSDEVVERAERNAREKSKSEGTPADIMEELERAERQIHEEKKAERERRRRIIGTAAYSINEIDPFDLFDIEPQRERGWHKGKPLSEKMEAMLKRNGFDPTKLNYTHAKQVIGEIINHPEKLPCTPGQAKVLRRFGYQPNEINKEQASTLIDAIAKNGWKRP